VKERMLPFIKDGYYSMHENDRHESLLFETIPTLIQSWLMRRYQCPKKVASWLVPHRVPYRSLEPIITWIGHATFLIQIGNINIMTDPILGQPSLFFPRILPPGISLENLPVIDLVLISHNHRDHMDESTLNALKQKNPFLTVWVPYGDKSWFDRRGFIDTKEYMWWERELFKKEGLGDVRCSFLPSSHWSQRGFFDKNRSLWGSWMIEHAGHTIYFAGDTAYHPHFLQIADEFPSIDTALMPIGPCDPDPWMRFSHMNAQEAGKAFVDLNAHHFIPMHWGTFPLGDADFEKPVISLRHWWNRHKMITRMKNLHLPKVGQQCFLRKSLADKVASLIMRTGSPIAL
jgi:L-ascorbate metabolism protein UlaG (beta-lactamase superfamily)